MVRFRTSGQSVASSLHQEIRCELRHQLVQNSRRTWLGLHLQKVPDSYNSVDNIIMMWYLKDLVIHFLWQMYCWAGEYSWQNKWYGGHWLWQCLSLTSTWLLCCSKSTARSCSICAMWVRNFIWAEREIKYWTNAIKFLTLKTSDFIIMIPTILIIHPSSLNNLNLNLIDLCLSWNPIIVKCKPNHCQRVKCKIHKKENYSQFVIFKIFLKT